MAQKANEPVDKGLVRVLVYGTLKRGHANHILLREASAKFIGYESVTGPFKMFDLGNIPAVVDDEKERLIRGELWAMEPEGLAALDLLEGHPTFYQRRKVWTNIHKRRAWMYCLMENGYSKYLNDETKAQLWRPSQDESKFWLKHKKAS